ncbi:TRAP dicarboxylate transporter, extracellular solute binding protein [Alcanivorax sp. MD8A]|uniref:TRAP transporter substrate-binding protein DctP n=1 Tax=Alcanivorax sp. MD8A TaxID=1177157 RepID=UPI000C9D1294|nr:TRAP transporter substrate-binding protein DctP [Alcanivorax sp. MD8A]MEE2870416.1 TRAP transporter substrate-binding protein DctP [Pseudomonadota bacterium]PNE02321.1 TRAP dicarboxylate transporter, extracellular solute binding protein [Alcanivorax sp. MD8A]
MHLRRLIGAATLGVFTLSTTAMAETWRFGLEEIEGSVQHRYAEQFEKRIEERSNGDIDVQLLPYGKWGSSYSALYDAIQGGAIQIGFASGALGGTVPESQLLNLNYIMPADQWRTAQALNSDTFLKSEAWQNAFRQRGLVPLAELAEGYQVWTANKAIRTPADMENLGIRVMDNTLLRATYRAYGAAPTSIAYGELYSALQQGQAEGNIQPVFAHEEMAFYEVQDYMIFADQSQFVATVIGNSDWYDGLSDEQRTMVDEVTRSLVKEGHDIQTRFNKERLDIIRDKSDIEIIELTEKERKAFEKMAKPVRKTFAKEVGAGGEASMKALLKAIKETE